MNSAIYRAHTNIALIKYWGKKDEKLFLPMNNSLSLTLDALYTDTKVEWSTHDQFFLNGVEQSVESIQRFVDLFRESANTNQSIKITSFNHVPTASGLASSASAFAALSGALNQLLALNLDDKTLSTFARRGSGSASRSIFGGFVEWHAGYSNETSFAEPIDDANWDIAMIIIKINTQAKKISSREGMKHTVQTSDFYQSWVDTATTDLMAIKSAIKAHDIQKTGEIMEANAMKMHATMLAAKPPFTYFEPNSLIAMQAVRELRDLGYPCYFTMDAGPNVKVLCLKQNIPVILNHLQNYFSKDSLLVSNVGSGIRALSEVEWEASQNDFYR